MQIIKATCLFVILTCTGCGMESFWYNEKNTYQHARTDCLECLYQAQLEISKTALQEEDNSVVSNPSNKPDKQKLLEECMETKGYQQIKDYQLDYYIRKGYVENNGELYNIAGK